MSWTIDGNVSHSTNIDPNLKLRRIDSQKSLIVRLVSSTYIIMDMIIIITVTIATTIIILSLILYTNLTSKNYRD